MTMMRRHARSESPKIVRKVAVVASETPASAEIGSRVFTLSASSATMPSAGGRRSTRVFVPKASRDLDSRVLGPGKRIDDSEGDDKQLIGEGEWIRVFREGGNRGGGEVGKIRWCEDASKKASLQSGGNTAGEDAMKMEYPETSANVDSCVVERKFGVVFDRKRRRGSSDLETRREVESSLSIRDEVDSRRNRRFGVVFSRKGRGKKLKVMPLIEDIREEEEICREELRGERESGEIELRVAEASRSFAMKAGVLIDDVVSVFAGRVILTFLVEPSYANSSRCFLQLLNGILRWVGRASVNLRKFSAFLLSGSLANVFSRHGVHILPRILHKDNGSFTKALPSCGVCEFYGARNSTPSMSLSFLCLPSYFKTLHTSLLVGKLRLSATLTVYFQPSHTDLVVEVQFEEKKYGFPTDKGNIENVSSLPEVCSVQRDASDIVGLLRSVTQNAGLDHSKMRKHKKKRSSPRYFRKRSLSSLELSYWNSFGLDSKTKSSVLSDLMLEPIQFEVSDALTDDSSCRDESDISTPVGCTNKHNNTYKKSVVDQIKEKADLVKVRQNIMTTHCKANVLVTVGDRCWREEGFEVMLNPSSPGEYIIAIKRQDEIRYSHKPQNMKPCVVNRFTRAYMWTIEDGLKLEFSERWDWLVFKELHMECQERNRLEASLRVIPVPGVHLVSGYHDFAAATSFERPDEYITVRDDEVKRALKSNICIYDMDSDDEIWLRNVNSSLSQSVNDAFSSSHEEQFENIIYTFEKDAYINVDHLFDKERALELFHDLADRGMLSAIYDYWREKRNKRHAALVGVFRGPPMAKVRLKRKSLVSKKRSFKRQKSQSGRQTQEIIADAEEKEEASLQRVQEAESAAKIAAKTATNLRSRAQILMGNADLAVYKSVMALRIAEAIQVSESTESASSFLDLVGEEGSL